jgi:NUMOD1 domain
MILNIVKNKIKGKLVNVTNIDTNVSKIYSSISEAALALDIERSTLRTYIKNKKTFHLVKRKGTEIIKEKFIITLEEKHEDSGPPFSFVMTSIIRAIIGHLD